MLRRDSNHSGLPQGPGGQSRSLEVNRSPEYATRMRIRNVPLAEEVHGPISHAEKYRIYDEWTRAGKPHNLVCSACRTPDNLIMCETCCRSYHTSCLQVPTTPLFHCPSCRHNEWDQSPPQLGGPISSNVSRSSTPSLGSAQVTSPGIPSEKYNPSAQPNSYTRSPNNDPLIRYQPTTTPTIHPDLLSRARSFLTIHGQFPSGQEFNPELLSKIGSMLAETESQHSLQSENQRLRDENACLRNDNANMREYIDLQRPREPAVTSPVINHPPGIQNPPVVQAPTPDTEGKSWDRIMIDLI